MVEWKYEKVKEFIKKTSAGFAAHCKKSIGKISEVIKEIFAFDTMILDTFLKKSETSDKEDLSDLVKKSWKPPVEVIVEVPEEGEKEKIQAEI